MIFIGFFDKNYVVSRRYFDYSAFDNALISAIFSALTAESIFMPCSKISRFLQPSNMPFMTFVANGAHVPLSINATVLFWKLCSTSVEINSRIKGKIPPLYVVVASTILLYRKASAIASDISHLARS